MLNHALTESQLQQLKNKLDCQVCKIAYMGSSVTVQKKGYRIFLHRFLQQYFQQQHLEITAAIGGVGSIAGVFAMDEDVVKYQPSLCFVEYAVSDRIVSNTPKTEVGKVVEGMARKLREIDCQVVFLYRYLRQDLIDRKYHDTIAEYEKIARHYQITTIDFGSYMQQAIDCDRYSHEELFKDHTHTTKLGSQVAAEYISSILQQQFELKPSNSITEIESNNLKPIYRDNYQQTKVIKINADFVSQPNNYNLGRCGDKVKNHHGQIKDDRYLEIAANNSFKFKIQGKLIGLMVIIGRDSGIVEFKDNQGSKEIMLWDKWCHYDRFSTSIINRDYPRLTDIEIKITDKAIDYSSCRREITNPEAIVKKLKLVGLMVKENTQVITDNKTNQLNIPDLIQQAHSYQQQNNWQSALQTYRQAIDFNPSPRVCINLARYIISFPKKFDLTGLLQQHPNTTFYLNLARAFDRLETYNYAITCYRQAIQLKPNFIEDLLPIIYSNNLKQNKPQVAKKTYQQWLENYYLINHQHKIIYCPIPKNACTLLKEILIINSEHQADFEQSGLDVHRYIRQNRHKVCLGDISYLQDPEYLTIAAIRNPLDRLVSGYLNKIAKPRKPSPIVKNIIRKVYRDRQLKPDYQKSITFQDFVNYLTTTEDCYLNEHWRSQTSFLGRDLFQFDRLITLENIQDILRQLETRIKIEIPNQKTINKTNYGNLDPSIAWHRMYPQELRKHQQLPSAELLCNEELITAIRQKYDSDWQLYHNLNYNLIP